MSEMSCLTDMLYIIDIEISLEYKEEDGHTKVSVCAADSSLKIEKSKEMCTSLLYFRITTEGFVG